MGFIFLYINSYLINKALLDDIHYNDNANPISFLNIMQEQQSGGWLFNIKSSLHNYFKITRD